MSAKQAFLSEIIGQDRLKDEWRSLVQGEQATVMLLTAPKGAGKSTMLRALAKAMLCEGLGVGACGDCASCKYFEAGNHPDYSELWPDKSDQYKVADLREQLLADLSFRPRRGRARVFVLQADALNEASQNALLKSLEEPLPHLRFLLECRQPERLLPTLLSRVQVYRMDQRTYEEWEQIVRHPLRSPLYLKEGKSVGGLEEAAEGRFEALKEAERRFLYAYSSGQPGLALEILQQEDFWTYAERVRQFVRELPLGGFYQRMEGLKVLMAEKERRETFFRLMQFALASLARGLQESKGAQLAAPASVSEQALMASSSLGGGQASMSVLQVPQAVLASVSTLWLHLNQECLVPGHRWTEGRIWQLEKLMEEARQAHQAYVQIDLLRAHLALQIGKAFT